MKPSKCPLPVSLYSFKDTGEKRDRNEIITHLFIKFINCAFRSFKNKLMQLRGKKEESNILNFLSLLSISKHYF